MSRRGRHIRWTFAKHWLGAVWESRAGLVGGSRRRTITAQHLARALEDLGPAFIKLGQLISVRPDVFPPEYVFEMESLRDAVVAIPFEHIRAVIERDFARPLEDLFDGFEERPLGSASIAQVHRATLKEQYRTVQGVILEPGTTLAIKVVRPGTLEIVEQDIALARPLAARLHAFAALKRFNLPDILDELALSMRSECDLRNEARTSDRFAFDFARYPRVCTAPMVWSLISPNVLTMGYVEGYSLSESAAATAAGVDARGLAVHGAEVFMRQVLETGRFHADLHQSNLIMTPDSRICYIDFGIMGEVAPDQRDAITQVLIATVYGDAKRAILYSAELGLVISPHRQNEVEDAVAALMKRTLGATPRDLRGFVIGFLGIMNDERVAVPRGFGLLVKGLVIVEGCAQMIYPDIDIIEAAKPYATQLIAQRMMSPARIYQRIPQAMNAFFEELVGWRD